MVCFMGGYVFKCVCMSVLFACVFSCPKGLRAKMLQSNEYICFPNLVF